VADNRDHQRPKTNPHGAVPVFVDPGSEPTGVDTDAQTFRSLKALHRRLDTNEAKAEAAHEALTAKVGTLETATKLLDQKQDRQSEIIERFDEKLDTTNAANAKIVGYLEGQQAERIASRSKSPSSMMRLQHGDASLTLAGKIVDDQLKTKEWWRTQTAKIISSGVVGAVVTFVLHKLGVL